MQLMYLILITRTSSNDYLVQLLLLMLLLLQQRPKIFLNDITYFAYLVISSPMRSSAFFIYECIDAWIRATLVAGSQYQRYLIFVDRIEVLA